LHTFFVTKNEKQKKKKKGVEVRAIAWSSWAIRATGYAYYDAGVWFDNKM
jgi:hypothetical protein